MASPTAQSAQPNANVRPVVPISITPVMTAAMPVAARVLVAVLIRIASFVAVVRKLALSHAGHVYEPLLGRDDRENR
jgi:hypothetical protein